MADGNRYACCLVTFFIDKSLEGSVLWEKCLADLAVMVTGLSGDWFVWVIMENPIMDTDKI